MYDHEPSETEDDPDAEFDDTNIEIETNVDDIDIADYRELLQSIQGLQKLLFILFRFNYSGTVD